MKTLILLFLCLPVYAQMHIVPDMKDTGSNAQKINDNFTRLDMNKLETAYFDRGDPASYDFVTASFTCNAAWHVMDLSSYIPTGAKAAVLFVEMSDGANVALMFRKNGNVNPASVGNTDGAISAIYNQVANRPVSADMIVPCDADRKIAYLASNTTFTSIYVTVKGYFK